MTVSQSVKKMFDKRYLALDDREKLNEHNETRLFWNFPCQQELLSHVGELKGKIVLCLGAGTGSVTEYFRSCGANVVSIDIVNRPVDSAKDDGKYCQMDAECLAFKNETFDLVYVQSVLFILDKGKVLREVNRVLKENGCFVVSEILDKNVSQNLLKYYKIPFEILKSYEYLSFIRNEEVFQESFGKCEFKTGKYLMPIMYYLFKHIRSKKMFNILLDCEAKVLRRFPALNTYCLFGLYVFRK